MTKSNGGAGEGTLESFDFEFLEARVASDPGAPEFPALAEAHRRAGRPERARQVSELGLTRAPERMAGCVSLGLALLDLGDPGGAREAFAGILDTLLEVHRLVPGEDEPAASSASLRVQPEPPAPEMLSERAAAGGEFGRLVNETEIERAFAEARSEPEHMHSANEMAESVLRQQSPEIDEGVAETVAVEFGEECDAMRGTPLETFKTRTMAALLEEQGDHSGARLIREQLCELERPSTPIDAAALPDPPSDAAAVGSGEPEARRIRVLATLKTWLQNLARGTA